MQVAELEETLMDLAHQCLAKGPGYAQEGVVLREAYARFRPRTLEEQQRILDAWHGLFMAGKLSWGYDLDNPGPPFFHLRAEP
jgi:hypothetical protein